MNPARKLLAGGAIVAAVLTGGAIGASVVGTAGAASATTAAPATTAPAQTQHQAPDWSRGGHQHNGITEALLTGTAKAKATAAAEKAVPGATAQRVENDAEGATYEVHMTRADGSIVTVKLDADFAVTATLDGMG